MEDPVQPGDGNTTTPHDADAGRAVAELVDACGPQLYQLARRCCGNADEADDLVQEVFLRAFRAWHGFRGDADPATWLYRIAARACQRLHRRRVGEPARLVSLDEPLPCGEPRIAVIPSEQDDEVQAQIRREAIARVEAELACLDERFRVPLLLKEVAGLGVEEVAEVLGLKADTVRSRIHRARMKLRDAVDGAIPRTQHVPPPTPYSERMCLDLLNAKQLALDHGVAFDSAIICERCRSLFATLDLTQNACQTLASERMPAGLRETLLARLSGGPRKNPKMSGARRPTSGTNAVEDRAGPLIRTLRGSPDMFLRMIYDDKLAQAAYLIGCQKTGEAVVVDPERDVDRYLDLAKDNGLNITAVAETHIHADFLSGARELAEKVGAKVYASDEGDADWKYGWLDGYDHQLLHDGDTFNVGNIELKAVHTPGHTPEHLSYLVTDHGGGAEEPMGMATGDFVFVGDLGRPDLLESAAGHVGAMDPSARRLRQSVLELANLTDYVQVWPAHGAGSACGKSLGAVPTSTLGYERRHNEALRKATDEQAFVDFILSGQPEPPLYFADMKRLNRDGPPVLGELPDPPQMKAADLRDLDGKQVAILDTRKWDDFRAGHVPGAMSFPLGKSFNTDVGSLVGIDEDLYLICRPGEVEEAARDLVRIGYDRIRGWVDASEVGHYAGDGHDLESLEEIDADRAAELVHAGKVDVLDVRRETEHEQDGHIDGSTNIAHTRLRSRLDEVPTDKPLLVHCRSGARSSRAASYLQRQGVDLLNLKGGMLAWQKHEKSAAAVPA